MFRRLLLSVVVVSTFYASPARGQQKLSPEQSEFFEAKVRPVLVEHCYECHNSTQIAEANLALDHRAPMIKGGDNGSLFDSDQPQQSLLLKVLRHEIEGLEMPEGGGKLSPSVIADLQRWIEMGAPDPRTEPPSVQEIANATSWETIRNKRMQWWSFQPIAAVDPPAVSVQNPIDRFVIDKLNTQGLTASASADRQTVLRRVSFALIGLPPTQKQIQQFMGDASDDAFETVVDRLLASPKFGERWARHWMDWIRYAESHGSEGDPMIENAWMYRDYLIRALNDDVPYNQLVKEHIAGDLLPEPRINQSLQLNESLIATAHWRMVFHGFAPTDALDEKVRFTDDQIDTFSKAFLGLTVSCARCHNHKFDAISQADYYALFGIFGSTRPGRAAADSLAKQNTNKPQLTATKDRIRQAIAEDWLNSLTTLPSRIASLPAEGTMLQTWHSAKNGDVEIVWNTLANDLKVRQQRQLAFDQQPVGERWNFDDSSGKRWFAYGTGIDATPSVAGEFMISPSGNDAIVGIFPSAVISGALSTKHSSRLESPQVKLNGDFELWLNITGGGNAGYRYVVQNYPRNGTVYPVKTLNGKSADWQWQKFDLNYWNGDDIHVELTAAKDAPLLTGGDERSWFGIREAVLLPTGSQPPSDALSLPLAMLINSEQPVTSIEELTSVYVDALQTAVSQWRDGRISDDGALLLEHCRTHGLLSSALKDLPTAAELINQYRQLEAEVPVSVRVPTLTESQGQDQHLFERGNHKQPGVLIPRRFLEAIDDTAYSSSLSGRLQLADDVLRSDNPLTRRVIVNRIWHHLFGAGIVTTPDNFGRLGAEPSHPELLDFLADRFSSQQGWSLKSLIRSIVTSKTWQQVSTPSAKSTAVDPQNVWLSHANVRRLEAEAIRDQLLMVSGNLDANMFGAASDGTGNRRSVYVSVIRNRLDPFLNTFDSPVPFGARGRRDVTNVPAQSLLLLNDPFVVTAAGRIAGAVVGQSELTSDIARVQQLWQQCLGRQPNKGELASAFRLLESLRTQYSAAAENRKQLTQQIAEHQQQIDAMLSPVRKKLEAEFASDAQVVDLKPIAVWDFEGDANDRVGGLNASLIGTANIEGGALVLDGNGWASTEPITNTLTAKTLEVTVQLSDLNQRSGGAMTVQGTDGGLFDSIVFAEREPRRWMSGSNSFVRTQDFNGPEETEAASQPVHMVLTYQSDGTITAYRNGDLYGQAYKTGTQAFPQQTAQVVFGMRHGRTVTSGRMLKGKLFDARLYDRALTAEEVKSAANGGRRYVTEERVLADLPEPDRYWVSVVIRGEVAEKTHNLQQLGPAVPPNQEWTDLAHSLLNLKEFIYVR